MQLTSLTIRNFRGIKSIDLSFGDVTVLIGENNSGKTAVLDAIRIGLYELRSSRSNVFEPFDFHLETATSEPATASPIVITMTFDEGTPGAWLTQTTSRLNRAKILQVDTTSNTGRVFLRITATYDRASNEIATEIAFLDMQGAAIAYADSQLAALQNEVSCYYLSALRDAGKHFDSKGPFWRAFLKSSSMTDQQKAEIRTKLDDVNSLLVTSHKSFEDAVAQLEKLQSVMPFPAGDIVSIEAVPLRLFDLLSKAQVHLGAQTGARIPVVRHGEGMQSLAVLMLFRAFLETRGAGLPIVALEEPEAHLHPSAIRALWKEVQQLPGQKIVSTHSGDILSEVPVGQVVRLKRSGAETLASRLGNAILTPEQARQFNFHVRASRAELLFARCWILVEGESECIIIPAVAERLGIDLHRLGVRCVAYRHGSDIGVFLAVATALEIAWCAMPDDDTQGKSDQTKVRDACDPNALTDHLHILTPNLEEYLCYNGFGAVYAALLTHQTQACVTVATGDPQYYHQVASAIPNKLKTTAAMTVAQQILSGTTAVPPLFEQVLRAAERLAERT